MGCDIHLYTEKKLLNNNTWWCCDHFQLNPYYGEEYEKKWNVVPIYDGRSYSLFTALAGVRDDGMTPVISDPRGLPDDVSEIIKQESDDWGVDGHSHSWLTAKELFIYQNKHPFTNRHGMVDGEELLKLDEYGIPPRTWCGWTNSKTAQTREWLSPGSVVDELVKAVKQRMAEEFWIWDFLDKEEKEKRFLENSENFRIVFWFDN